MSIGVQLTLYDLEVEEGRRTAPAPKRASADNDLSVTLELSGTHRVAELEACPLWLLTASIRSGCPAVEDLVAVFISQAKVWKCPLPIAAAEMLFAWNFYRDWDEAERVAGELLALVTRPSESASAEASPAKVAKPNRKGVAK